MAHPALTLTDRRPRFHAMVRRRLTRLARTRIETSARSWSTFELSGYFGAAAGSGLAIGLAAAADLSPLVTAGTSLTSMVTFLVLVAATVRVVGWPYLNCYYHSSAVLGAVGLVLWATGQPVLPYLDVITVGLCLFLVCGRLGCLMVGCCHGRPHLAGITYGPEHAIEGFPSHYVGIPLFPVQLLEATLMLGLVTMGTALVARGASPGTTFASCLVGYALGRSLLELIRGDAERPYWLGASAAQWASGAVAGPILVLEATGVLPQLFTHQLLATAVLGLLASVVVRSMTNPIGVQELLGARHLREVARTLTSGASAGDVPATPSRGSGPPAARPAAPAAPVASHDPITVQRTGLGLCLSGGMHHDGDAEIAHYTMSGGGGRLTLRAARLLARRIVAMQPWMHRPGCRATLVPGRDSEAVFHLLLRPMDQGQPAPMAAHELN